MSQSRKKKVQNPEAVPRWFVTYSDVITLLMTFFILLLTFASSEPEGFAMMRQSLFGTGGSSGNVGTTLKTVERDTVVVRTKPWSSRLTSHGSEMPPMYTDPVTEAASRGLTVLDDNNDLSQFRQFSLDVSIALYLDQKGEPTEVAVHQLALIAGQMQRLPLNLTLTVASPESLAGIAKLAEIFVTQFGIEPGRLAVSLGRDPEQCPQGLRLTLRQEVQ